MKNLFTLFICCVSFFAFSQDANRSNVRGKIIFERSHLEGITIYNSSSNTGTITDEKGAFNIAVALNDLIEVRSIEYQNLDIKINKAVLESKRLSIFLIQQTYKLNEVLISNKNLSGNISTDIKSVKTFNPQLDVIYFGINNDTNVDANSSQIENTAIPFHAKTMVNGLNVINIVDQLLIPLFRSEVKDKKAAGIPEVPSKAIKYYLGSNFLVQNFGIPEHRVEEFIRYVEDEAFDFNLLNYGHEMEFLELLNKKSTQFLNTEKNN